MIKEHWIFMILVIGGHERRRPVGARFILQVYAAYVVDHLFLKLAQVCSHGY